MSRISGPQTPSRGCLKWYFTEILILLYYSGRCAFIYYLLQLQPEPPLCFQQTHPKAVLCCCLPAMEVVGQINFLYGDNLQAQTLFPYIRHRVFWTELNFSQKLCSPQNSLLFKQAPLTETKRDQTQWSSQQSQQSKRESQK